MVCKLKIMYSSKKPIRITRMGFVLEMRYPRFNLPGFANIPELLSQVAAGPAHNIHSPAILVVTDGALPLTIIVDDDFSIKPAHLAVVALGVKLGVLDVVVNELDNSLQGIQVLGHIGNLSVGNASSAGDRLELVFKAQLRERINMLPHINVVAVGVVALVGDIRDITKPLTVNAGKPVAQRLGRGAVESKPNIGLLLPVVTGLAKPLHYPHGELSSGRVGVTDTLHHLGGLIQANVAQGDGGVAAVEQGLDRGSLGQPGDGAVLPVDGAAVRSHLLQSLMPAHQGVKAKLQPFFQDSPELILVSIGQERNLGQVEGHNTLVDL